MKVVSPERGLTYYGVTTIEISTTVTDEYSLGTDYTPDTSFIIFEDDTVMTFEPAENGESIELTVPAKKIKGIVVNGTVDAGSGYVYLSFNAEDEPNLLSCGSYSGGSTMSMMTNTPFDPVDMIFDIHGVEE